MVIAGRASLAVRGYRDRRAEAKDLGSLWAKDKVTGASHYPRGAAARVHLVDWQPLRRAHPLDSLFGFQVSPRLTCVPPALLSLHVPRQVPAAAWQHEPVPVVPAISQGPLRGAWLQCASRQASHTLHQTDLPHLYTWWKGAPLDLCNTGLFT